MARLQEKYSKEVAPALMEKFSYKSTMQIPKLEKIVINIGCGEAKDNAKALDGAVSDLAQITGQKPIILNITGNNFSGSTEEQADQLMQIIAPKLANAVQMSVR